MKLAITFICLFISGTLCFAQENVIVNKSLADSLSSWVKTDQIAASPKPQTGSFKDMDAQKWNAYKDSVFKNHQLLLADVFDKYGYPGYSLVGKQGSNNYWLMVQHCDKSPGFQIKILDAMKTEVAKGNADPKNYAYLTDRVKLNTGQKQIYGTQVTYNTQKCQALPKPVADSLMLDKRRKEIGLEPINIYLNQLSDMHFTMNQTFYEKKGILKPMLYKVDN